MPRRGQGLLAAALSAAAVAASASAPAPAPTATSNLSAQAWVGIPGQHGWPELKLPAVAQRPAAGIAFSGGGSRSYTVSLAYLAALRELGLLEQLRYMTGISGGSWAVSVFAYARREYCCPECAATCSGADGSAGSSPGALNVTRLLGPTTEPGALTWDILRQMPPGSATAAGTVDMYTTVAKNALEVDGDEIWYQTIQEMYLEPVGISRQRFTWSKATAAGIAARNPSDVTVGGFQTVRDADQAPPPWPASMPPFPIVGTTLLGPKALAPYPSNNKSYTMLEITPLYVGMPVQHNITYYHHHLLHTDEALNRTVGGYLEPFAFGGPAPSRGLPPHVLTGLLQVPRPSYNFSVAMAAGDSSFAPGGVLSQDFPRLSKWLNVLGATLPYWSPAAAEPAAGIQPQDQLSVYADGGIVENLAMIGLIRRGVTAILACFNAQTPLASNLTWDPTTQHASVDVIDPDLAAYFGINIVQLGQDEHRDQIFAESDFVTVAQALQAAQATGDGIVATTELVTVQNPWWGVPAGLRVNVTWLYLGRTREWEAQLPADIREQVVPSGSRAKDPHKLPQLGPFRNFPNLDTASQQVLSTEQANLLSSLAAWTVRRNQDKLKAALMPH